jgi:hypothetical protein
VRQLDPALQNAVREASDGLAGGIGMKRTEATSVPCVQGLEQIKGFSTTHFADDDSVRPVAQSGLQQVADGHGWQSSLFAAGFQSHQVGLSDVQFSRVLDQQNPFINGDRISEDIQKRSLSAAGSSADKDVLPTPDLLLEQLSSDGAQSSVFDKVTLS